MYVRVLIHDQIVKEVKQFILDNKLNIGDKLPSQGNFVTNYGFSKNSVREAFRTLAALKIIKTINGKGSYVLNNNINVVDEEVIDKKQKLLWTLDVRKNLEMLAAELALKHAEEHEIKKLKEITSSIIQKQNSGEKHAEEDKQFHYLIFSMSHNPVLIDAVQAIDPWFDVMWKNPLNAGKAFRSGVLTYETIVECIEKKNEKMLITTYLKFFEQIEVIINNI